MKPVLVSLAADQRLGLTISSYPLHPFSILLTLNIRRSQNCILSLALNGDIVSLLNEKHDYKISETKLKKWKGYSNLVNDLHANTKLIARERKMIIIPTLDFWGLRTDTLLWSASFFTLMAGNWCSAVAHLIGAICY